ncbi:hypothetical protein [Natronoglycomyces albus]|uniref:Uncharacterized protein n=1 Tax=Natronoglycomyces albus TaxID=2811108 RepID=A0A895Y029_9ACTN|nr:hypothetical protein [Natronoglycomyces albus]QSB07168.1 hypothetical protein JQS30_17145 [Natronoglycomyces albus]
MSLGYFRLDLADGHYLIAVTQYKDRNYLRLDVVLTPQQVSPLAMVCHRDLATTVAPDDVKTVLAKAWIAMSPGRTLDISHISPIATELKTWALRLWEESVSSLHHGPNSLRRPQCSIRGVFSSEELKAPRPARTHHKVTEIAA